MRRYLTEAEFAAQLGAAEERVAIWRRQYGWPHLSVGRTIRYTDEHIAAIERMQTVDGKHKAAAGIDGQTEASKKRAS